MMGLWMCPHIDIYLEIKMLEELNIHNYALIDRVTVKFTKGLNLLTGETGAGKSILIGALGMLLGKKAEASVIRTGAEETLVSGIVNVADNPEALEWLAAHGIKAEDDAIILRRSIKQNLRGSIYIQSTPATRSDLEELASLLFDLHGQHEHQSLLNVENHRKLLDRFGDTEDLALRFGKSFMDLSQLREKHTKLLNSERERLREIDFLRHAIEEIGEAALQPGEEEELEKEQRILANHEKLFMLVEEAYSDISESSDGALVKIRKARHSMEEAIQIDTALSSFHNQLEDAFFEIEDFIESIRQYKTSIEYDPKRLETCQDRLSLIQNLKKKYGDTIEEVLELCRKSQGELDGLENWEEQKQSLKNEIARLEGEVRTTGAELSAKRKKAATVLQEKVETELRELGMPKVRFAVSCEDKKTEQGKLLYGQFGSDAIEFLISPNLGEPWKPLRKIASGGEISRVMLAVKSVLSEADHVSALIFDEVDAGIGGEVAIAIGEKLKKLSARKQVLCITHLATIAVRADNHVKVEKTVKDERTFTKVFTIRGKLIREEIARMLSGDSRNEVSLTHAEELLRKYGSTGE
jgi:DNA repair protein RecN (Recombination protein N)